jgi:hypothetical protein
VGLPELVAESGLRDSFTVRLKSLRRRVQREISARATQGIADVAAAWQNVLASGAVKNRAALARQLGRSRARVTQVLRSADAAACSG